VRASSVQAGWREKKNKGFVLHCFLTKGEKKVDDFERLRREERSDENPDVLIGPCAIRCCGDPQRLSDQAAAQLRGDPVGKLRHSPAGMYSETIYCLRLKRNFIAIFTLDDFRELIVSNDELREVAMKEMTELGLFDNVDEADTPPWDN
jgi:hypothetical protein